jgi:hypothetical protein
VAGFIAQRPSRQPFLGSIQSGTRCAQIPLSKNSAMKRSRELAIHSGIGHLGAE